MSTKSYPIATMPMALQATNIAPPESDAPRRVPKRAKRVSKSEYQFWKYQGLHTRAHERYRTGK